MNSTLDLLPHLDTAFLVAELILASLAGIVTLLVFVVVRRTVRGIRTRRYDAITFKVHGQWREIVRGEVPPDTWRKDPIEREIVQSIVLQEIGAATDKDRPRLQEFLRANGLVDAAIERARSGHGSRRRHALLTLGTMRVPEAIAPLSDALDDWQLDTRLAAVHALGMTGLPQAAEPMLECLMIGGLKVPSDPVSNALVKCFIGQPEALLPYLRRVQGEPLELLARVASEVATPAMADEMLVLAGDSRPEVRASAARGLAAAPLAIALPALADLVRDPEWYVRLRATSALSTLRQPRTIPPLLEAVRDANRLVRVRAAVALSRFEHDRVEILQHVVDSRDRYALHAMISALELGGGFEKVMEELSDPLRHDEAAARLIDALREGAAGLWSTRPADPVVESVFP
jgi:HEAT repeat protein